MNAEYLTHPGLAARHGFFTRRGGVSTGPYASLNCSLSGGDDPAHIAANRALVAEALKTPPNHLLGVTQIHGTNVITAVTPWPAGAGPQADAMVTAQPGIALGVITADCAPVLFHDPQAAIIGAAHAGWRGAAAGILEATLAAMAQLGANPARVTAVIGPCIAQPSYEVGPDLHEAMADAPHFFKPGKPGHWHFDLAGYCAARLQHAGAQSHVLAADTCADEARFFSHRRRTLAGGGVIGHQISAIKI